MAIETTIVLFGESTTLELATYDLSDGSVGTYKKIGNRVTLNGPDGSRAAVETTTLDSKWRTFRPSNLPQSGSLSGTLYYNPADVTHDELMGLLSEPAGTAQKAWKLTYSDGTKWGSVGFLERFALTGVAADSNIQAEFSIHLTGEPQCLPVGATGLGMTGIFGATGLLGT